MEDTRVKFTLRLDENAARALKILSAFENKKVNTILTDLVVEYIKSNKHKITPID